MEGTGIEVNQLLEELGIDPERFRWEDLALCKGLDTEIFYSLYENDPVIAKAADDMCLHCPVMKMCHAKGQKGNWGLWGGVYWNGSGKEDPARSIHKTEEVRAQIDQRLK